MPGAAATWRSGLALPPHAVPTCRRVPPLAPFTLLCSGNLAVLDWELSPQDYAALSSLPFQQRMVNGAMWLVRAAGRGGVRDAVWGVDEAGMQPRAWLARERLQVPLLCGPLLSVWLLPRHPSCSITCLPCQQNPKGPYRTMEELWDEPDLEDE